MKAGIHEKSVLFIGPREEFDRCLAPLFHACGYRTLEAVTVEEALQRLGDGRVDLLVVDLEAWGGEGARQVARLREGVKEEGGCAILGLAPPEGLPGLLECLQQGLDDYLLKPVAPRLLYQRLQSLLELNPRSFRRIQCQVPAELSTGRQQLEGWVREVGEGGVSVLLEEPLEEGDIVKVGFTLPGDGRELEVATEVVYRCEQEEGTILHGLRFVLVDREDRRRIARFVEDSR